MDGSSTFLLLESKFSRLSAMFDNNLCKKKLTRYALQAARVTEIEEIVMKPSSYGQNGHCQQAEAEALASAFLTPANTIHQQQIVVPHQALVPLVPATPRKQAPVPDLSKITFPTLSLTCLQCNNSFPSKYKISSHLRQHAYEPCR